MVDFNRFGTYGTANELQIRAERLRVEVEVNRFWYDLVTLAIPRFSSREDAERVALFINRRMTRTRRMELEIHWLDSLLKPPAPDRSYGSLETFATLRKIVPPPKSGTYDAGLHLVLLVISALLFSMREALGATGVGALLLILAGMCACFSGVHVIGAALLWVSECIEARRDMLIIRSMSEQQLLSWIREQRVAQVYDAAQRAPLPPLRRS